MVAFTIATKSGFKLAPPTKLPGGVFTVQIYDDSFDESKVETLKNFLGQICVER